jgi:preprotein translocase subunit SecE
MNSIVTYLRETRGELKHVSWPTARQTYIFTVLVIVISIAASLYLGFFDYLFSIAFERFIVR